MRPINPGEDMRHLAALTAVLVATAAMTASAAPRRGGHPASTAQPGAWRPMPIQGATEPADVIARSAASDWRPIAPENLLVMDLADGAGGSGGRVIIELAPAFAPVHVANMRRFARAGWWNEATIYRVQENYVAQWGNGDAETALPEGVVAQPPAVRPRAVRPRAVRPRAGRAAARRV